MQSLDRDFYHIAKINYFLFVNILLTKRSRAAGYIRLSFLESRIIIFIRLDENAGEILVSKGKYFDLHILLSFLEIRIIIFIRLDENISEILVSKGNISIFKGRCPGLVIEIATSILTY